MFESQPNYIIRNQNDKRPSINYVTRWEDGGLCDKGGLNFKM